MTSQSAVSATALEVAPTPPLARTPLYDLHLRLGAKLVPFAGTALPLHYPAGVLKEHLQTRASASLFDVSHMGQIVVSAPEGKGEAAAQALETLLPIDILGLAPGRQRYGFLTGPNGGILDDVMVANLGPHFVIVVNGACKAADAAHLRQNLPPSIDLQVLPAALLALQGPAAEAALARLLPQVTEMRFMDARAADILGTACVVSRSGYTGEDGFEISVPAEHAERLAEALLADPAVQPAGLGARDSLRLEAGLCLHGSDIDNSTTPVEAALVWAIQPVRRSGGARSGGFPGCDRILDQIAHGCTRTRVGLRPEGRAPVRAGAALFAGESETAACGTVTSGGFGPSLQAPVAMGYVPPAHAALGSRIFADVRGQRLPLTVTKLPFVPARFKRG